MLSNITQQYMQLHKQGGSYSAAMVFMVQKVYIRSALTVKSTLY